MWKIIVLCIVTMGLATAEKVSYKNYKLFSIVPQTPQQLELLHAFDNVGHQGGYIFWKEPSLVDREVFLMVAPDKLSEFYDTMTEIEAPYNVTINNIQKLIDDTMPKNQSQGFDFHSYHTLEEIYNNLDELAKKYPNKVQVVVGGTTWEGRQIKGVKIFGNHKWGPGVFIEGGMHAREWIAPATVMYILHQILMSNDSEVRHIADNHNWFIFPVFNPDGYQYSFDKDRLWKKTLRPSSKDCIGSDPNRNWNYKWNTTGVSTNPCAENYPGSEPFSEVEMKSISDYMRSNIHKFYAYLSFHSFGQELRFPYAYTAAHNYRYDELYHFGSLAKEALRVKYQTRYRAGSIDTTYGLSGTSFDYVAAVFDTSVVYVYQLRDEGRYGFLLPPEQIIPTGEETLDSLVALLNETSLHKYGRKFL